MNTRKAVFIFICGAFFSFLLMSGVEKIYSISKAAQERKQNLKELKYMREAVLLSDCIFRERFPVSPTVVKETLENIDKLLPKYFPDGPFTRKDFIAMAWLESAFNQYETGTHGEKGIFQIMPGEFRDFKVTKNKYDLLVNAEICMLVLKGKFNKFPDYKRAIIAYNGVVKTRKGNWSEKYWLAFEKRREVVETLIGS